MKSRILILAVILLTQHAFGQNLESFTGKKNEKIRFVPSLKVILPLQGVGLVNGTPVTPIMKYSSYKTEHGKISNFGYGAGVDAIITERIIFFAEFFGINYSQELAMKGEEVHYTDPTGMPFMLLLPEGATYKTQTVAINGGLKYVFTKNEKYQPWIGFAYGLYIWDISFIDLDNTVIYGQDKGTSTRFTYRAGVDIKVPDLVKLTLFLDANAPVANYTIENLFITGKTVNIFDGHLFPTLRLGLSVGLN